MPESPSSPVRRRGNATQLLPLVALWAVPVFAIAVALPLAGAREAASVTTSLPDTVTVGTRTSDYRTAVELTLALDTPPPVTTAVGGLVTSVDTAAGDAIASGDRLVRIDDRPVVAFVSSAPLFRDIRKGDSGADVRRLSTFLTELRLLPRKQGSRTVTSDVATAITRFQKSIGVKADATFRTSYVAFVPSRAAAVGSVEVSVGERVAAGSPLLLGPAAARSVSIAPSSDGQDLAVLGSAPLLLTAGDESLPLAGLQPTPTELSALSAFVDAAEAQGSISSLVSEDGRSRAISGTRLALATATRQGVVASTAVFIASTGVYCVFATSDESTRAIVLDGASAATGELGSTVVDPSLAGTRVMRDATSVDDSAQDQCE